MAGNPLVPQGTLNLLRGSVVVTSFPSLNVTAPFLGKAGIRLTFEGDTTLYIDTMTGAVTSPQPYLRVTVEMDLLKTQNVAVLYKAQQEALSTIGDLVVYSDATNFPTYQLTNCSIMRTPGVDFSGTTPIYSVMLGGIYNINANLWNLN